MFGEAVASDASSARIVIENDIAAHPVSHVAPAVGDRSVSRDPSGAHGCPLAPLLEEERHQGSGALIAQRPDPVRINGACSCAALASDDDPVEMLQPFLAENHGPEQWLHR